MKHRKDSGSEYGEYVYAENLSGSHLPGRIVWVPGDRLAMMAEQAEGEQKPSALQAAEGAVAQFLNGGRCVHSQHPEASQLMKLIMLKQLRIEMPHQGTNPADLDIAIRREVKKLSAK